MKSLRGLALLVLAGLVSVGVLGLAQEAEPAGAVTVTVTESEMWGNYLTDSEGRAVYLFIDESLEPSDERMTEGVRTNAAPCNEACLEAWPPLTGEATAGEGVDSELLYTADVDGRSQVVYNGWPLYFFAEDTEEEPESGQGRGQEPTFWYLISPEGNPITDELI